MRLSKNRQCRGAAAGDEDLNAEEEGGERVPADLTGLRGLIRGVVKARVRDPDTVDDLVQETLARVLAASARLDDAALAPYAVATARNLVVSLARQQDRDRRHQHRLVELTAPEGPDHDVVRQEEREALALAFSKLPAEEHEP